MQLQYKITEQDFIDYNMNFVAGDKVVQRQLRRMQLLLAGIILIGGTGLAVLTDSLSIRSVAVYVILAAVMYFYFPRSYQSKVKKNVQRTIRSASNRHICGEKTLTIEGDTVRLTGESEDSTYPFSAFSRVAVAERQVYLHLDDITALIVPNSAFADTAARDAFAADFEKRIQAAKAE